MFRQSGYRSTLQTPSCVGLVDQPGSNWALGFDLPDKEEPGSEVGGVVFMGGLAHLRCTFRRPWGAHVALYPLPSCRLTSPGGGVAGGWYHSPAYENARHRHLGRLRGCDCRKRKTSRGYLNSGIDWPGIMHDLFRNYAN